MTIECPHCRGTGRLVAGDDAPGRVPDAAQVMS